jgi:hypothetical protein
LEKGWIERFSLFYFCQSNELTPFIPLFFYYLTPTALLKERGSIIGLKCITLHRLKEKEMEDEAKNNWEGV